MALTINKHIEQDRLISVGYEGKFMAKKEQEQQQEQPQQDQPAGANGIVLTGTEQFGERQGFVPASDAEAGGLAVTGKVEEETRTRKVSESRDSGGGAQAETTRTESSRTESKQSSGGAKTGKK